MARTDSVITPEEQIMIGEIAGIANSNYVYKNSSGTYVGAAITPLSGYTITNPTENRVLDEASATLTGVAQTLGTLINDITVIQAGEDFAWGSSLAGTSGTGVALTLSNNSDSGAIAQTITAGDTQANVLNLMKLDLGTSAKGHSGLLVNAYGASTAQRGIKVDGSTTGTGAGIEITGTKGTKLLISGGITGIKYDNTLFTGLLLSYSETNPSSTSTQIMSLTRVCGDTSAVSDSISAFSFLSTDRRVSTAITISESYDAFQFKRLSSTSNAGASLTSGGSVIKIENSVTPTAGTLTDSTSVLSVIQDFDSTGYPIKITQNALVSTHFKKIADLAGVTLWKSDGTDPNGALSGTAGDICFNGASNKPAYCTGTTNWTNLV